MSAATMPIVAKANKPRRETPFLSLEKFSRDSRLVVDLGDKEVYFLATKPGLRLAGEYLYRSGYDCWQHSSDLNHPKVFNCKLDDPLQFVDEGFTTAATAATQYQRDCEIKMLRWCDTIQFRDSLTPQELEYFLEIKNRVLQNA